MDKFYRLIGDPSSPTPVSPGNGMMSKISRLSERIQRSMLMINIRLYDLDLIPASYLPKTAHETFELKTIEESSF
jgi:hypothetical protein